ncbi:galactokinase [Pedobacter aquatilis]|uniref:galactokinase n=1 Tax=Pedobacter aquatilis TaxID=351343 RepID=UPI00293196C4|nr:galactokinase [Pedobacter aquatilis]
MKLFTLFEKTFAEEPIIISAPGRINLIGEHTDYNLGLSLPAAIDKNFNIAISKQKDNEIHLHSNAFEAYVTDLFNNQPQYGKWHTYIQGVVHMISKRYRIKGFNMYVCGNIPSGAGLSSSAALCCGAALAISECFELNIPKKELAIIAQGSEHKFAGVQCGLMDQIASIYGSADTFLKIDFNTLNIQPILSKLKGHELILLDTGVKHQLASTEYNTRREECQRALKLLKENFKEIENLQQATIEHLYSVLLTDTTAYTRAKFVIEENQRVITAVQCLESKDYSQLGQLLNSSHEGLSKQYKVSCPELDSLQSIAIKYKSILGARIMGGGFGGCTINLIKKSITSDATIEKVRAEYEKIYGFKPQCIKVKISQGARVLDYKEKVEVNIPSPELNIA